jgi:hypothetical protein
MLRVFENRVLRRIFGPKRDGVTGDWKKIHNEELHDLHASPNITRVIKSKRWVEHVARMAKRRVSYGDLVAETNGKSRERTRCR